MKELFEENKKFIVVSAIVLTVVAAVLIVFNVINKVPTENVDVNKPTFIEGEYSIPKKDSVNQADAPLTYDFVNGSLGLNEDYVNMIGEAQCVFMTKSGSSKIYFSFKQGSEGDENSIKLYLPRFSKDPIQYYLKSEDEMSQFFNGLNSDQNVKKITEGDYTFYVTKISNISSLNNYYGVDVSWLINNSLPGEQAKAIDAGQGIPVNIIREKCDLEKIKEVSGIDFNDSFWDNVNYGANIKCFNVSDKSKYVILSPTKQSVVAGEEMVYSFTVNGTTLPMSKDALSDYLSKAGYQTIDVALTNHSYANTTEISNATKL